MLGFVLSLLDFVFFAIVKLTAKIFGSTEVAIVLAFLVEYLIKRFLEFLIKRWKEDIQKNGDITKKDLHNVLKIIIKRAKNALKSE